MAICSFTRCKSGCYITGYNFVLLLKHPEFILLKKYFMCFTQNLMLNDVEFIQENMLEVWHSKENYGTLVGRRTIRRGFIHVS